MLEMDLKELNAKLNKLNETLTTKVDAKDEQINSVKKSADDKANLLAKENNQLKAELNKVNLELEKLENSFTLQVDEYEVEIENMSNKLKEKENTIKVSFIYFQLLDQSLAITFFLEFDYFC